MPLQAKSPMPPRRLVCGAAAVIWAACFQFAHAAPAAPARTPDAITVDGGHYFGPLVGGKLQGQARVEWPNGTQYTGSFVEGMMSGKGRMTMPEGVYEGDFALGRFEGQGKLVMKRQEYTGDFKGGTFQGNGKLTYADGRKYSGSFSAGEFFGKGKYEDADGQTYEGDFKNSVFEGSGAYSNREGVRHVGQFKNWRAQGPGVYTSARGDTYEGNFVNGEATGKFIFKSKDGIVYEGPVKDWYFDGEGVWRNAAGDVYRGSFSYGRFDGKGVMTYAKARKDGRTSDSGQWTYGHLDDPEAEKLTKSNVEAAIYNQRALLDKSLAMLQPRDPARINMYLLAVGGGGGQEVFRRETDYVQKQFDRHFATQGRSIVLVNSRTTVQDKPMATLTSIRESLNAIAGKMDKEKDILFLFMTSHGSQTHEFQLDQNGMDLHSLPATALARMLKESGIRWKVAVISACYSGGFIEPLKDDWSMIVTAARKDRTSFGCADQNEFTYFSEAFFKDSVLNTASFGDAFGKAKKLVAAREKADFKDSGEKKKDDSYQSEPQFHHAAPIDRYLKKWRAQLPPRPPLEALVAKPPALPAVRPGAAAQAEPK